MGLNTKMNIMRIAFLYTLLAFSFTVLAQNRLSYTQGFEGSDLATCPSNILDEECWVGCGFAKATNEGINEGVNDPDPTSVRTNSNSVSVDVDAADFPANAGSSVNILLSPRFTVTDSSSFVEFYVRQSSPALAELTVLSFNPDDPSSTAEKEYLLYKERFSPNAGNTVWQYYRLEFKKLGEKRLAFNVNVAGNSDFYIDLISSNLNIGGQKFPRVFVESDYCDNPSPGRFTLTAKLYETNLTSSLITEFDGSYLRYSWHKIDGTPLPGTNNLKTYEGDFS